AAAAALAAFRVRDPRVRHGVWLTVVAWMLALPLWTAWVPHAAVRLPAGNAAPEGVAVSAGFAGAPAAGPVWSWERAAEGLYLSGAALLLLRLAVGVWRARRLMRSAAMRDGRLTSPACAVPVAVGLL